MRHCKARAAWLRSVGVRADRGAGRQALAPLLLRLVKRRRNRPVYKEETMSEQWKVICKLKDLPPDGARMVQRGFAWQELPGVAVFRDQGDHVVAVLEGGARHYSVKVENGLVALDVNELSAPASRAEAALAGSFAVTTQIATA
jgi:nitrite reductase (NADH) small subunit